MVMPENKILIVSCVFPPEPVVSAQISRDLAVKLAEQGHKVTVIAPTPTRPLNFSFSLQHSENGRDFADIAFKGSIQLIHLNSFTSPEAKLLSRFYESFSFGKQTANFIQTHHQEFDKVYINTWPLFAQLFTAKACNKFNLPYIIHIQDIYPESFSNKLPGILRFIINKIIMPLERFYLLNAAKVIAISDNMKSHLIKTRKLDEEKLTVAYNWQNEDEFIKYSQLAKSTQKFTFTYLGNIGPVAGVETLIKAFQLAKLSNCRLIIAGGGSRKNDCMRLASLSPEVDIQFKEVPAGAVAQVQQEADVLLLPVIRGGALSSIPSKLPAYMFSSKPILATLDLESDTAQAIVRAGCGWVGNAQDEQWLADKMVMVSNMSSDQLDLLGKKGYNYCATNFSKSVNLQKILEQLIDVSTHSS